MAEGQKRHDSRRLDSRQAADTIQFWSVNCRREVAAFVSISGDVCRQREHMLRIETPVFPEKVVQRSQQETGGSQQHNSQAELTDDKQISKPLRSPAPANGRCGLPESRFNVLPRRLQDRRQTKKDCRNARNAKKRNAGFAVQFNLICARKYIGSKAFDDA